MSTDRDTTRIVRSWLEEGATSLPDRVLDSVLDQLPATRQRRSWWPPRRFAQMNRLVLTTSAAAAVLVAAIMGYNLLTRDKVAGPTPTNASTPTAPLAPTATPASRMPWPDGTYVAHVTAAEAEAARTLWNAPLPSNPSAEDVCPCDYSFEIRNGKWVGWTFSFAGDLVTFLENGLPISAEITVHWTFDGNQIVFSDMTAGDSGDRVVFLTKPFVKTK